MRVEGAYVECLILTTAMPLSEEMMMEMFDTERPLH